ncbi:Hypothetical predicted protein [Paramuricea clavata]|uniref:Uncharacterized protein n=1 Tax=Paramuricea clavata TaxID=317549 RepID=A0A7D9DIH3_PARCT|nr:Hypothetical predicted protein [Paramuricea clavata]
MAGASPPKRGRPKKDEAVVRIRLTKHIYDMWTTKKDSAGFVTKTHSKFAEYLMMNTYEGLSIQTPSSVHHSHVPCCSTPAVGQRKTSVNIHGKSTSHISGHEVEGLETLGISTMENLSLSINPEFGKHFGNPSSSETDTTSSESDSDSR